MKSTKPFSTVVISMLLIISASVVLAGTDDFSDNTKDTAKWSADIHLSNPGAILTETNGRLEFSGNYPAGDDGSTVVRPWIGGTCSYTQSWEVAVNLNNNAVLQDGSWADMFLVVVATNAPDFANRMVVSLYRERYGSYSQGYELDCWVYGSDFENWPNYADIPTDDVQGRVYISFDASTKVLTAYYNGNELGFLDVNQAGTGWGMGDSDFFTIVLGGDMGSDTDAGSYTGHELYADNFLIGVTDSDGDFYYDSDGSAITITDYNGAGGNVIIPEIIEGLPVTILGDWVFQENKDLTGVTIPDSVIMIGSSTFDECTNLTSIIMGAGVESYGDDALSNLRSLVSINVSAANSVFSSTNGVLFNKNKTTLLMYPPNKAGSFTIPDTLATIEFGALARCPKLTALTANTANTSFSTTNGILFNKNRTELVCFPGGKSTNTYAVTTPVIRIGVAAFAGCPGITNITIESGVTNIGTYAFVGCSSLTGITVNAANMFYSSTNGVLFNKNRTVLIQYPGGKTGSYTTPDSVTGIGELAFGYCSGLTNIVVGNGVTNIGSCAFEACNHLKNISLGAGLMTIGDSAFWDCSSLENITIPDSVINLDEGAFGYCTNLNSVIIGNGVDAIQSWTFEECASLTSVVIPDNVTLIGEGAFDSCISLTNVVMGNGVTSIGNWAFEDCYALANINIPDSVNWIGSSAFAECFSLSSIMIADGVEAIGDYVFYSCTGLKTAKTGNGLTSIARAAFYLCSGLTNITIGSSVTNIEHVAFGYCTSLTSVTIPSGVRAFGESAFFDCTSLTGVYFYGSPPELASLYIFPGSATVYRLSEATGWPPVPDEWAGRPTALWQPDSDADGLPDAWEFQYFGGTGINPDTTFCSNGVNTVRQAYIAGLDPTDPQSYFGIEKHSRNTLQWSAVSGRVYNVYWTTNLLTGFQPLETNCTGGAITDLTHSAAGKCFYKIDVRLAP